RQALVTTFNNHQGETLLVAYLSPRHGHHVDEPELRKHLASTLPSYMIPAHLITVPEFPLTTSGKVDRHALPAPTSPRAPAPTSPAPANPANLLAAEPASANPHGPLVADPVQANRVPTQSERPATKAEAVLTELFASLLNHPQLGPTDNFFT